MNRFTLNRRSEIVTLYFENSRSVVLTQRAYRRKYPGQQVPSDNTIRRLVSNFTKHGTVGDRPHAAHQRPIRSNELVEEVRKSVAENPYMSYRHRAQHFDVSGTTMRRILKFIKEAEDEAPADDLVPKSELSPEEENEEEQDRMPEPEAEVKPTKTKGSRKQEDDIPPVEEKVADIKDDIPESQDSEEEVKKPRGRKPAAKKASGAKSTSKKTTKAKKAAEAESPEESVNDDKGAGELVS